MLDEQVLELILSDSPETRKLGYEELANNHWALLVKKMNSVVGPEHSEDVVNEAFLSFMQASVKPGFHVEARAVGTYLLTTCKRSIRKVLGSRIQGAERIVPRQAKHPEIVSLDSSAMASQAVDDTEGEAIHRIAYEDLLVLLDLCDADIMLLQLHGHGYAWETILFVLKKKGLLQQIQTEPWTNEIKALQSHFYRLRKQLRELPED